MHNLASIRRVIDTSGFIKHVLGVKISVFQANSRLCDQFKKNKNTALC